MMQYHTAEIAGSTATAKDQPQPSLHGIPPGIRNKISTAQQKTAPKNAPANMKRRGRLHRLSGSGCMACFQPPCRTTMRNAATMRQKPTNPRAMGVRIGTTLQFIAGTRSFIWQLARPHVPQLDRNVPAPRGQRLAVRAVRHGEHPIRVPVEGGLLLGRAAGEEARRSFDQDTLLHVDGITDTFPSAYPFHRDALPLRECSHLTFVLVVEVDMDSEKIDAPSHEALLAL